jgi:hypothetical protein
MLDDALFKLVRTNSPLLFDLISREGYFTRSREGVKVERVVMLWM